jgi:hypothetical protein
LVTAAADFRAESSAILLWPAAEALSGINDLKSNLDLQIVYHGEPVNPNNGELFLF